MSIMRRDRSHVLIHTLALGLSCGVGFFMAHESYHKGLWNWNSIRKGTRKLIKWDVPLWLLAAGSINLYPLALWWTLKELMSSQEDEKQQSDGDDDDDADDRNGGLQQEVETSQTPQTPSDSIPRGINTMVIPDQRELESIILHDKDIKIVSSHACQRHLELLVHNISHTDLVLNLNPPPEGKYCLCRLRFSAMDMYTRRILEKLPSKPEMVSFPRYERSEEDPRHTIVTPRPSRQKQIPTGFHVPLLDIPSEELHNFRLRGRDASRVEGAENLSLNYVFFPLVAALIPKWQQQMAQKYSQSIALKKVLILVSGVGTPRNWTHSIDGNSTEYTGMLMERFVKILYPDITVVRVHSATNLFRYDENILFSNRELKPIVDAYRDAHACEKAYPDEIKYPHDLIPKRFSPDWKKSFHVSLSYADGSPARIHAIQAALRPYRPSYLHFWQLKSFWHDTKIVDDDIEVHSFEEMETAPAMEATTVNDADTKMVIREMISYRNEFLTILDQGSNDVKQFWLRKSQKPVLAVLLVKDKDGKAILYRGTNLEVSQPTGSLCAERNVIGTALAANPGLKREDLKMVAVLAVPLAERKGDDSASDTRDNMPRNMSMASFSSIVKDDHDSEEEWVIPPPGESSTLMERELQERMANTSKRISETPPGTPIRRIPLYGHARGSDSKPTMGMRKQKKTVLVHSDMDLNPLRPCGACNEWLKKISESNPYFSVVTFTDAECAGVYVTPCQE